MGCLSLAPGEQHPELMLAAEMSSLKWPEEVNTNGTIFWVGEFAPHFSLF